MKKIFLLSVIPALLVISCRVEKRERSGSAPVEVTEEAPPADAPATPESPATPETPAFDVNKADSLVGQKLDVVKPALEAANIIFRVVEQDGEPFAVTADYNPDRLNFKIKGGVITAVTKG